MSLQWLYARVSVPTLLYRRTITKAVDFLHKAQRPEGPWFGSWGICFTYATQFALESLSLVGETYENSKSVRRACDFLVSKQRADGGWGESYKVRSRFRTFGMSRLDTLTVRTLAVERAEALD